MNESRRARRLGAIAAHVVRTTPAVAAQPARSNASLPITNVKIYTVGTRLDGEQLMLGNGRPLILVKVEAGELYGWGECGVLGRELAVKGAVDHFRQFIIGSDAMRSESLVVRSSSFLGHRATRT